MKIVVAGGTGFIGGELVCRLAGARHEVVVLTRSAKPNAGSTQYIQWDGASVGSWSSHLNGAHAVINLSGKSIAGTRWTKKGKEEILSSRLNPTRALVQAIAQTKNKPPLLVNMSGVGYYGNVERDEVTEAYPHGSDFLASVCRQWEEEARSAELLGLRVAMLRLGVVLEKGGALQNMMLPFKLFAGGSIGSGRQGFPWIHRDDVIGIIMFALEHQTLSGPVNAAAPELVTMKQFTSVLGTAMHRPSWAPVPGFVLRIVLGEMSEMLLGGQRVIPQKLLDVGYKFMYPKLEPAGSSFISEMMDFQARMGFKLSESAKLCSISGDGQRP